VRRSIAAVTAATLLVGGYAALDSADLAPGLLTTRPLPPPPPTETPGTRTLPVVPQPSASTSVGMPLPALAGDEAAPSPAGVEDRLADVLRLPALRDAALVVRDGQDGTVLFEQAGDEPRIPASTTKMLSAAAIGRTFGPDETLHTKVVQGSTPDSIILVAGGDTLLAPKEGDPEAVVGRAGLGDLADQVAKALETKGVTSVSLAVDVSYAPGPLVAPTWASTFRPLGITGAVAMLGRADQRAVPGKPGPADPVASTRDALRQRLVERGIRVSLAETRETTAGPDALVLGSVASAPVREQLAVAINESDNGLTEVLARQAAFRSGAPEGFAATGSFVVDEVSALGIDTTGIELMDGSGLSRENRVTADLLAHILVLGYDGEHPVLRAALDGLPVGGLTGTLADRFTGETTSDAAGRARAKTGTLTGANALAGSVVDDDGRLLVYAGLVAGAGTLEARAALDRFVAALAACGCR
jgi:D-alanyl-D-alanine carboxypeptidase/D-alanyl-D-alanine-endopeptidase (penicillin-binding protein 4)